MITLIPRALHLHDGPMKDVGRRFKKCFDRVWRKLGPSAKKTITTYFRLHPGTVYLCFQMDYDNQDPFGRCYYDIGKSVITFSAPYFAKASSDKLREDVIAHELAHIYRRGSDEWTAETEVEEVATRALASTWGYRSPTFQDQAHKTRLNEIEEKWRTTNRERFGRELESRWLPVMAVR
jgi:hypothetical protein